MLDWDNKKIEARPPRFVYDRGRSHVVYESDEDHCTTVCGRYVRGVPGKEPDAPKCRQCAQGVLRTKVPAWQRNLNFSPLEIKRVKTKNPRRLMKRGRYS